jgi:hypothetical protein
MKPYAFHDPSILANDFVIILSTANKFEESYIVQIFKNPLLISED